jgi:DNA-binding LacI/PurR family transcriptional regulator
MPVTQQDIAKELGISRVLVSYALNGNPRVGADTRRRVQETAERLGYRPNRAAQTLVTGRTGQIALCFFSYQVSFNSEVTRRFQSPARAAGYDLLITNLEAIEHNKTALAIDGAICQGIIPDSLLAQNFPAVSYQVDLRGVNAGYLGKYDVIEVILEDASRQANKHLVEQGCRRIAYVSVYGMMGMFEPRYRLRNCNAKRRTCRGAHLAPIRQSP